MWRKVKLIESGTEVIALNEGGAEAVWKKTNVSGAERRENSAPRADQM